MEGISNIHISKFYNRIENGIIRFKKYSCKIIFFSNDLKASSRVIVEKKLTESKEAIKLPTWILTKGYYWNQNLIWTCRLYR